MSDGQSAMNDPSGEGFMLDAQHVKMSKKDLEAAWAVLENLSVSLDQVGGVFGDRPNSVHGGEYYALGDALIAYLNKELVESISDARSRLARYVSDEDAELIAESIRYWDYAGLKSPS